MFDYLLIGKLEECSMTYVSLCTIDLKNCEVHFQNQNNKIVKMNHTSTEYTQGIEHTVILFVDV